MEKLDKKIDKKKIIGGKKHGWIKIWKKRNELEKACVVDCIRSAARFFNRTVHKLPRIKLGGVFPCFVFGVQDEG